MPKGYLSKGVPFGAQWQTGKLNPGLSVNKAMSLHIISHYIILLSNINLSSEKQRSKMGFLDGNILEIGLDVVYKYAIQCMLY